MAADRALAGQRSLKEGKHTVDRVRTSQDRGFTLIEVLMAMLLFGILCALAVGPFRSYGHTQAHKTTTRAVVSSLRNAQVSAVAENVTYRVDVAGDGRSLTVFRVEAGGDVARSTVTVDDAKVSLSDAQFLATDGSVGTSIYFYPRGSASRGRLFVVRDDRDARYAVRVEGLTARVSYDEKAAA